MSPPMVYLDTGPLIGVLDVRDGAHERAKAYFERTTETRARIRTPYPVLLDLHRLLVHREPPRDDASRIAVVALERVREVCPVVHPEDGHLDRALAIVSRLDDPTITLTEATIAAMAVAAGARVMTFDRGRFERMGASVFEAGS